MTSDIVRHDDVVITNNWGRGASQFYDIERTHTIQVNKLHRKIVIKIMRLRPQYLVITPRHRATLSDISR